MNTEQELKDLVRDRYDKIAHQDKAANAASCCGATACGTEVYNIMTDDYTGLAGYAEDADLGLGCGLPTAFAQIKPGDTVIDLGSGAGNDCFVARHETGPTGKVIGIDFTPSMIAKARTNADKLGFNNVEFREGDIDAMPVADAVANVVVSNCVLNLVPNKQKVIAEMHRVLKPGGHFSVSDIVLEGQLPEALRHDAEMYAGCVAGAIQKSDYLNFIKEAGFENITVQKSKPIIIPDDLLEKYLNAAEINDFKSGTTGIFSITVYGEKSPQSPHASTSGRGLASGKKEKLVLADIKTGATCCGPDCC
jgi:ubiquinone/menaquinone biosynthesis C-methylase UbiE